MTGLLIKFFIKDRKNVRSTYVREAYGRLAGIVGIITNTIVSSLKIFIGLTAGSIAVMADGINNLMDISTSVVTLVGFKMASKKRDKEHPYGHARYEYIAGIIVSILIIVVGIQLLFSSVDEIRDPSLTSFRYWIVIILVFTIIVKLWQTLFYRKLSIAIDSATLKATAMDSRNDVIASSAVLASVIIDHFTAFQIDGYMGILVALFIIFSGISLIRETTSPLLGQAPNPILVKDIEEYILSFAGVLGVHDLVVHDYGPGSIFATVHIEVDADESIQKSHELVDDIETLVGSKMDIDLIGHMDPINIRDPLVAELNELITDLLKPRSEAIDFHDLRIVKGDRHTNVIFDLVLNVDNTEDKVNLRRYLQKNVTEHYPSFYLVINYDIDYTNSNRKL